MPKRKIFDNDAELETQPEKKKKIPKIKLDNSPPVSSIKDLIHIGKQNKFYKNINSFMLWDILPYLEELEEMIGMQSVKDTIFFQVIYYLQNMHSKNKNEEYLHTAILGSPGTGKTSLARIIGDIYKNMGILSKSGTFKIGNRTDFVGQYLGETANKTIKFLKSCLGGVLFIDEVYSLGPGSKDRDSFSKEAVDTINAFLSENKNNFCCIIAGYKDEVKKCFFSINPGLERRFPWIHEISDYTNEDLTEIFLSMVSKIKWDLHVDIDKIYLNKFFKDHKDMFKNFGGSIETFISKCKMIHAKRVFCLDQEHKFVINKEDIEATLEILKKNNLEKDVEKKYDYYN